MKRATWKRLLLGEFSWARVLRSALLIYGCLLVYALVWSNRIIFQPQPATYRALPELTRLRAPDGHSIPVVACMAPGAEYAVLYCHANAVDLGQIRDILQEYQARGVSAFSFEYRGYGVATGRPTTHNACRDAETVYRYLTAQHGIRPDRIILHGRSVGGGPALYVARKHPVAGVIAQSTFVSAFRVMTHVPLAPFDRFRNLARIAHVDAPVLVMHGRADTTIPPWHGETLYKRAREPKMSRWFQGIGHDDLPWAVEDEYWATIDEFLAMVSQHDSNGHPERSRGISTPR